MILIMNNIRNSVRLTGFAGTDPVIVDFANHKRLARVSIAVNESFRNSSGELVIQTQWVNLAFWNKKVQLIEGLVKKGTGLSVEGRLTTQSYTDKKGELRFTTEIVVNTVEMMAEIVN
jgi:single-strand DNA-binding protein